MQRSTWEAILASCCWVANLHRLLLGFCRALGQWRPLALSAASAAATAQRAMSECRIGICRHSRIAPVHYQLGLEPFLPEHSLAMEPGFRRVVCAQNEGRRARSPHRPQSDFGVEQGWISNFGERILALRPKSGLHFLRRSETVTRVYGDMAWRWTVCLELTC